MLISRGTAPLHVCTSLRVTLGPKASGGWFRFKGHWAGRVQAFRTNSLVLREPRGPKRRLGLSSSYRAPVERFAFGVPPRTRKETSASQVCISSALSVGQSPSSLVHFPKYRFHIGKTKRFDGTTCYTNISCLVCEDLPEGARGSVVLVLAFDTIEGSAHMGPIVRVSGNDGIVSTHPWQPYRLPTARWGPSR